MLSVKAKRTCYKRPDIPKLNVTQFLNTFPVARPVLEAPQKDNNVTTPDRAHVKIQSALIELGRAEGCSVWVSPNDRNLSYKGQTFAARTLERLPNFGFDENTRRIVQNIDVSLVDPKRDSARVRGRINYINLQRSSAVK